MMAILKRNSRIFYINTFSNGKRATKLDFNDFKL